MNRERYMSLIRWAKEKPIREKFFCTMTKIIPVVLAFAYLISIVFCLMIYRTALTRLLLRPMLCFVTVTVLRNIIKAPRPYDVLEYVPLCSYHPGKNRSFPSRHTASAVILALEIHGLFGGAVGFVCILLALMMGTFRVLCGNHYIKDVIAGFLIALLFNCI